MLVRKVPTALTIESNVELFEENGEEIVETFFSRPYGSTDKAKCERNHKFVRYILPRSRSLNNLTHRRGEKENQNRVGKALHLILYLTIFI
jgi:IS30 family transposase